MSDHLAFAPDILRRLGEELVPHTEQGIVELARNAYDADATTCTVELKDVDEPGGSVLVSDNGIGMDKQAITKGWLVLGRSPKSKEDRTELGRVPAGDKGLGRLAALRLGDSAVLRTRPRSEPGVEYSLTLDWKAFDAAELVEDVPLRVEVRETSKPQGTDIEMRDLRARLRKGDLQRLARALILLSDPFESASGFKAILRAPGFREMEERVNARYFDEVEYRIVARLDSDGRASARLLDWRGEPFLSAGHDSISKRDRQGAPYETPPADFELWAFNLSSEAFSQRSVGVTEVRKWLSVVGGVHVYQNELRVPPYGDSGVDWLSMNLRRARSPEARPSTNNSVGRVRLSDSGAVLVQKTDRSGFVEGEAFTELRAFAMDVLDWAASERLRQAEKRRAIERQRASKDAKATAEDAEKVEQTLEKSEATEAAAAFSRYRRGIERQLKSMQEDVLLYRTLGTVGTTTSAFAHESVKPAARIEQVAKLIRTRGRRAFGDDFDSTLGRQVDSLSRAAAALTRWAQMPLHLLKRNSRRAVRFDLGETVEGVCNLLQPFMTEAKIELDAAVEVGSTPVYGPPAAAEAIVMNLIVNAINALVDPRTGRRKRVIRVECFDAGDNYATLSVADSGTGVLDINTEDMWLPGRTTRDGGTGLGLTIVRDSVDDLGGDITAVPEGSLAGAEFIARIPLLDRPANDKAN